MEGPPPTWSGQCALAPNSLGETVLVVATGVAPDVTAWALLADYLSANRMFVERIERALLGRAAHPDHGRTVNAEPIRGLALGRPAGSAPARRSRTSHSAQAAYVACDPGYFRSSPTS